jgi:Zn-dependent metalloprotease
VTKLEDPVARGIAHAVIGRMLSVGIVLAMVLAGGQSLTAFGASSPAPSPSPGKAQRIAAEQSDAVSAGKTLGLGNGEKLIVKDVITDADGSTNVRYDRNYNGLRVIGGDLVSHRDKSGRIKGVSWNASDNVAVPSTTPKVTLASAQTAGAQKAAAAQKTIAGTKGELVVYAGSVSSKVLSKVPTKPSPRLAYDVLTEGVRADQTPSRLHTIVDANTGATLASWDEIENGTGNSIYSGAVPIGTTGTPGSYSVQDAVGNYSTDLNGLGDGSGTDISTVPGTTFTDADDIWGNGAASDRTSAGVDAQYGAEKTFDYFKNIQGRNGIWDTGVGARSRVHYGTKGA